MITGHMPSSGGVWALEATLETGDDESAASAASEPSVHLPSSPSSSTSSPSSSPASKGPSASGAGASGGKKKGETEEGRGKAVSLAAKRRRGLGGPHSRSVSFYKAWDQWGALSNFSPHPVTMPVEPPASSSSSSTNGASSNGNGAGSNSSSNGVSASASSCCQQTRVWSSVEHYYQVGADGGREGVGCVCERQGWLMCVRTAWTMQGQRRLGPAAWRVFAHTPGYGISSAKFSKGRTRSGEHSGRQRVAFQSHPAAT